MKVDLNCDLGESFGAYTIGADDKILPYITSANVACGFHASDPLVMQKTVQLAKEAGVKIGAHPGYPDLMGFGRRNMNVTPKEVKAYIQYQLGALMAFCTAANVTLHHVKPHGAMYNMAAKDEALAHAVCEAVYEIDPSIVLLALSQSAMIKAANETGLRTASEVFADRAYEEDGTLVARSKPGSMITEEDTAIKRVVRMVKEGVVTSITGKEIELRADSICVHGDGEKALVFTQKIKKALEEEHILVAAF